MREDRMTTAPVASSAATIRYAGLAADLALARALFIEYAQWLKVDLCFQGFDEELATLPGAYVPPRGRLLLAGTPGEAFGCIALRPLDSDSGCGAPAEPASAFVGEVKRLYVQPAHRGEGWGERLARALIDEARAIGYRELKLDTLDWMTAARALYAGVGFRECVPYYHNPLAGVVYMALTL
jgi:GNAT superfamily N-acetyltransferase